MEKKLFGEDILAKIHMETVVDMRTGLISEVRFVRNDGKVYSKEQFDELFEYIMNQREADAASE